MESEPNNIISDAVDSNISSTAEQKTIVSGSIDLRSDIDLYKFQLKEGLGITIDLDTVNADDNTPNFDSYLRVFDEDGNELTFNDDFSLESEEFSPDSYIGFIANKTGNYYVGVSSVSNSDYNAINGDNINQSQDNFVPGDYELDFNIVEVVADKDDNNTISEAIIVDSLDEIDNKIDPKSDVDIFRVEIGAGEGIKVRVDANIDSQLDSYLRIFDSQGNELAFDDNSENNPGENAADITTNSAIDLIPPTPGEYFIGVSSAGNFNYDVINGNTNLNLLPNTGFSTGTYDLQVDVIDIVADEDPDNTISEAINSGVTSGGEREGVVTGEIDLALDADLYQIQLAPEDGVYLDLNAKSIDSELDSYLRIFDSQGNELTFDDNDDANFIGDPNTDSAIAFAPSTPGEYYIGVSDAGNLKYDPVNGRTNFSSNVTSPFSTTGSYDLNINITSIVSDEDADNTISEAIDSNISSTGTTSNVLTDSIDSMSDVDIYSFQLDAGDGVTFDLNAATQNSNLDSYLRLFDSEGNELAFDDDDDNNVVVENTTADSLLNFVADTSGKYYIGVSSQGNSTYDAINGSTNFSNTSGFSTGDYELAIDISPVVADSDLDDTISEAIDTGVGSTQERSTTISDTIAPTSDVDLYKFQLNAGNTVTLDVDAAIQDSNLDSVLRLFDSTGNEVTNNDDGIASNETSSTDSFIEFTTEIDAEYYVGVSSFPNFEYDPINGSTNFSNNLGTSSGNYDLTINIAE